MPPKVKDDKTFGMKNKNKSAKVQKFIQTVKTQEAAAGKNKAALAKDKANEDKAAAKEAALNKKRMEAELFKTYQPAQKVPFGTDPKTILCNYFKAGHCEKGNKCKFSHDPNVGRKVDKVNLYEDTREDKKKDNMEDWDEAKLRSVVTQQESKQKSTTDIVCKFFIQAVEDKKYGWFWECPNGGDKCMYRHRLPPGFVLKADKKKQDEDAKKEKISLEDFLEVERHKLKPPLTPVTPESFAIWKKTRLDKKAAEQEALEKAKNAQRAAGKLTGLSGRALFEVGGEIYEDEEDGEEDWDITRLLASYREEDREREEAEANGAVDDDDESGDETSQVAKSVGDLTVNGS